MPREASFGLGDMAKMLDSFHQLLATLGEDGFTPEDLQALREYRAIREIVLDSIRDWALNQVIDAMSQYPYFHKCYIYENRAIPAWLEVYPEGGRILPYRYTSRSITTDIIEVVIPETQGQYHLFVQITPKGTVFFDLFIGNWGDKRIEYLGGKSQLPLGDLETAVHRIIKRHRAG